MLQKIQNLVDRIDLSLFGTKFNIIVSRDKKYTNHKEKKATGFFGEFVYHVNEGRIYIQIEYAAPCTKTGKIESWKGRKWYLSII